MPRKLYSFSLLSVAIATVLFLVGCSNNTSSTRSNVSANTVKTVSAPSYLTDANCPTTWMTYKAVGPTNATTATSDWIDLLNRNAGVLPIKPLIEKGHTQLPAAVCVTIILQNGKKLVNFFEPLTNEIGLIVIGQGNTELHFSSIVWTVYGTSAYTDQLICSVNLVPDRPIDFVTPSISRDASWNFLQENLGQFCKTH